MPRGNFYAGLPLAEQLSDHHHDPNVRHISSDEAAILYAAVDRLTARRSKRRDDEEFDASWRRLGQIYATTIVSPQVDLRLQVISVPRAHDLAGPMPEQGFEHLASGPATPRSLQIALNALVRLEDEDTLDVAALWEAESSRRSPPADKDLRAPENELLNRALYQPTVAVEQSPPTFRSLVSVVEGDSDAWITVASDLASRTPLALATTALGIVVMRVVGPAARGLGRGLEERLYRWARPKPDDKESEHI